ncbi:NLI interacting factor-like phosphatase-domain-containing protein [Leucosporidium creatinivorum]|uniref:NLI interacting factor-like phosphatase-domain-containing protein n=1 Tax=Leucosporidium creatinivorum TaxID=106004 RepID=A0A1Y2FRX0_9BASI|nr:NLI interacting factor-like phosphatase-domain-containing protein [Leucosporidium creatinivorum]
MNTLSYLSSLLSRPSPSPPPSPSSSATNIPLPSSDDDSDSPTSSASAPTTTVDVDLTTTADSDADEEPETLYLSARAGVGAGAPPVVSLSDTPPPHLQGRVGEVEAVSRRASVKRRSSSRRPRGEKVGQDSEENEKQDDGGHEKPPEDEAIEVEAESELEEGERLLKLKRQQLAQRGDAKQRLSRIWPIRLSVGLYVLFRQILSWVGVPYRYSPRSGYNALLAPPEVTQTPATPRMEPTTIDTDTDSPSTPPPPNSTHSHTPSTSSFFLRPRSSRSPSPSPTPSPPPSPTPAPTTISSAPRPPRLTPKTLVLDLDETLIHSTSRPHASSYRNAGRSGLKVRVVEVVLDGRSTVYTVYKRPWVDFFLRKVSSWYTVIIFTASLPEYADPVIDWLDGGDGMGGMVGGRLFRSDCLHANGSYVKDLSVVDADLSRVCLVDNSPVSYAINQANGIPIEGWINDPADECLLDLLPMLDSLRFTSDVRRVLGLRGFRGEAHGAAGAGVKREKVKGEKEKGEA